MPRCQGVQVLGACGKAAENEQIWLVLPPSCCQRNKSLWRMDVASAPRLDRIAPISAGGADFCMGKIHQAHLRPLKHPINNRGFVMV